MKYKIALFCLLLVFLTSQTVGAFSLPLMGDTYISSKNKNKNYGDKDNLIVNEKKTSFIQFDMSTINAYFEASSIISAVLRLYVKDLDESGTLNLLHFVDSPPLRGKRNNL